MTSLLLAGALTFPVQYIDDLYFIVFLVILKIIFTLPKKEDMVVLTEELELMNVLWHILNRYARGEFKSFNEIYSYAISDVHSYRMNSLKSREFKS
jgi:hypothetical protein